MTSESGGAAFNPTVHTEDHAPAEPEQPREERETDHEAATGPTTGEDRADGVR